jgi:Uma2 family endonuclease
MSALPKHEVWTVADLPEDTGGDKYEIYDGSLHVTPQPTNRHTLMAVLLAEHLAPLARNRGLMAGAGWGISPTQDNYLVPDLMLVSLGAVTKDADAHVIHPQWVPLVVEVVSPSTQRIDHTLKVDVYRAWNIPHYWILDQVTGEQLGDNAAEVPEWMWAAYTAFLAEWQAL